MEFKSLKNIESSFRQIRLFGIVFLVVCMAITGYSIWSAYSFAEAQRQKIYVLDGGKSLMLALSQDLSQNRPVEAREHVKRFHELFFTLSPDKSAIEGNIKRALQLADRSAFNYYTDFAEKGYYNRIISGNVNQVLQVDSVSCNFDTYPYKVNTYARQMIIRESNVTERSLVTRCNLLNSVRSDNNPHGFTMKPSRLSRTRTLRYRNDDRQVYHKNTGLGGRKAPPPVRTDNARKAAGSAADDVPLFQYRFRVHLRFGDLQHGKERGAAHRDRAYQTARTAKERQY